MRFYSKTTWAKINIKTTRHHQWKRDEAAAVVVAVHKLCKGDAMAGGLRKPPRARTRARARSIYVPTARLAGPPEDTRVLITPAPHHYHPGENMSSNSVMKMSPSGWVARALIVAPSQQTGIRWMFFRRAVVMVWRAVRKHPRQKRALFAHCCCTTKPTTLAPQNKSWLRSHTGGRPACQRGHQVQLREKNTRCNSSFCSRNLFAVFSSFGF